MRYEDKNGQSVDTKQLYRCPNCGSKTKKAQMKNDYDHEDYGARIYSPYCCPKCGKFYLYIEDWDLAF